MKNGCIFVLQRNLICKSELALELTATHYQVFLRFSGLMKYGCSY